MERVDIPVTQPYEVMIGRGLINDSEVLLKPFIEGRKVLIVTEENVEGHGYLKNLKDNLNKISDQITFLCLPPGEAQKSILMVERIISYLAELHFSRDDVLIALGGGVIGDLVGFTASIYLRGIDYIQIPTTFLAAIDSSVGGKTAVDIAQGKNLVGAFHHPVAVLCDINTFETLPTSVFEDGCSELIKYAMIMNEPLLQYLVDREEPLNAKSLDLVEIVKECVIMKKNIVIEDEFDQGLRQLLNFGHTLGHALEQSSKYHISHGRGVALGMLVFTKMAVSQTYITEDFPLIFKKLLDEYHLLGEKPHYTAEQLIKVMQSDKKRRSDQMTIVLPSEFGHCELKVVDIKTFQNWFEKEWDSYEIHKRN
ncbi:3-dehydroquinate synthase [Aerococcaceae bacterium DSM 111021]|nr:3-dehydroquinate synthase [Aerococcaceae bacterium DSM 111021]